MESKKVRNPEREGVEDSKDIVYLKLNAVGLDKRILEGEPVSEDMVLMRLREDMVALMEDAMTASRILEYMSQQPVGSPLSQTMAELGVTKEGFERALRIAKKIATNI